MNETNLHTASLGNGADTPDRAPATDLGKGGTSVAQLRAHPPAILNIPEACALTTLSRRAMADLLASGRIASKKIGRRRIILRSALEKFVGESLG